MHNILMYLWQFQRIFLENSPTTMYRKTCMLALLISLSLSAFAQKTVSITIDDVPNTGLYARSGYRSVLLEKLDSLAIPIAIFINEGKLYRTDSVVRNFGLLKEWISRDYMTLGNHTYSHARYSATGLPAYERQILKGEAITRALAEKYDKELNYFRFPYNDAGKDSAQHADIEAFLAAHDYILTPFTIESSDWMYYAVYAHYVRNNQVEKAQEIGEAYVEKTLAFFDYFEEMVQAEYGRPIHHIYLCHDNLLNTHYLPQLVDTLKQRGYSFISLDEAMTDEVYQQEDHYDKKFGVSWLYRWKTDHAERVKLMRAEPSTQELEGLYEEIQRK